MSYRNQSEVEAPLWPALAVTSFAVFAAALDATVLFVAFPDVQASFPLVSLAELSWVLNAYTIVFAALLIPMGRFADRLGRRRVFSAGVVVFTVGSALSGLAPSAGLLIAFRIVQAIGAATVVPASLALVLGAFPQSRRSAAVGIWAAVGAVAAALGPSLGAVVVEAASWRWTLFLNIPLGMLTLLAIPRVLTESRDPDATPPAITGVVLLVAGVAALALGIVQGDEWGWTDTRTLAALTAALILISLFMRSTRRASNPAIDLSLFDDRNYRYANLAMLVFGVAFAAMFLGFVLFLTGVWGYSILEAGLAITPGPVMVAAVAPFAGRLAGHRGHRVILLPGTVLYTISSLWLLTATATPDFTGVWLPSVIVGGLGVGMVLPALTGSAVQSLPEIRFGVGSAINQAVRQIGGVFGVAAVVAFLTAATTGPDLHAGFDKVFLLVAAGGAVTGGLSTQINTKPRHKTRDRQGDQ